MADVRLTATNPEDSSVVPVACDASGRLLLEEMPPAFDGTVDGDLTVTGKGTFAGGKSIIGNDGSAQFAQGAVDIYANGKVEFTQDVTFDGSASFAGRSIELGYIDVSTGTDANQSTYGLTFKHAYSGANNIYHKAGWEYRNDGSDRNAQFCIFERQSLAKGSVPGDSSWNPVITFNPKSGSATFAGNKAGFTAEGYLWCTTRRGDTVILDATSNGLASWVEYTPTTRIDDIRDKLNAIRGDASEMPADTP